LSIVAILTAGSAHADSRTVNDQSSVVIDAQAAGAVGDGQTDNLDALTALFDSAPVGATVHFAAGTYLTSGGFQITKSLSIACDPLSMVIFAFVEAAIVVIIIRYLQR
jgi:hypothetical protein